MPLLVGGIESVAVSEMLAEVSNDWPIVKKNWEFLSYLTTNICDGNRPMVGLVFVWGVMLDGLWCGLPGGVRISIKSRDVEMDRRMYKWGNR